MSANEVRVNPERISEIPMGAGVYLFWGLLKDKGELRVLYVGKSKKLRARVRSYFSGEGDGRPFIKFIQEKTEEIRYLLVNNEEEALILENELIKKYKPPYNIMLKDDKRYLSIRIDAKIQWPKMEVVRRIKRDHAFYMGPFSSATQLRTTLDFMQKIFPLRTCSDHKLYNRSRPCIEYEIKRCVAPCVAYITEERYRELVHGAMNFLKGQHEQVLAELKLSMNKAAENERYEEAAVLRDRVEAVESTIQGQSIIGFQQLRQGTNHDALGIVQEDGRVVVILIFIRHGIALDKRVFELDARSLDAKSFIIEFLNRYYSSDVFLPDEIWVPWVIDPELLDIDIPVIVPRSDEKRKFVDLAEQNARAHLEASIKRKEENEAILSSLQKMLHLSRHPYRIDCMDISHHQGSETVASSVRFVDGQPEKSGYRKIKISVDMVDDFASMVEAVDRRYKSQEDLPDLLVIDGGKGQLSSAERVLRDKGWLDALDLISIAKARDLEVLDPLNPKNRERIFKPGQKNPILLRENSPEELFMSRIRDEAHRFAIEFHRKRKELRLSKSVLDDIPGMTPRLKVELLKKYRSIDAIFHSEDQDLLEVLPQRVLKALRLTLSRSLENMDE